MSSGSADAEPYCDEEGNISSNGSQEWIGTRQKKGDTIDDRYNNDGITIDQTLGRVLEQWAQHRDDPRQRITYR